MHERLVAARVPFLLNNIERHATLGTNELTMYESDACNNMQSCVQKLDLALKKHKTFYLTTKYRNELKLLVSFD